MQTRARLTLKTLGDLGSPVSSNEAIPCFRWDDRTARAQSDRYMPFLSKNIKLGCRDVTWVETATTHPQLLSSDTYNSLGCNLRGNTDVVVAERSAAKLGIPQSGLRLLLELRKAIKADDVCQALGALIVANLFCPELQRIMVSTVLVVGSFPAPLSFEDVLLNYTTPPTDLHRVLTMFCLFSHVAPVLPVQHAR